MATQLNSNNNSDESFAALARIDEIERNLRAAFDNGSGELHPCVIDSCVENVRDDGHDECDVDYWSLVLTMLVSEITSEGYDSEGRLR